MARPRKLVYVAEIKNRPLQIRYKDPATGKTVHMSSGITDQAEAEKMAKNIEAKLTLNMPVKDTSTKVTGPLMAWADFRREYTERRTMLIREKIAVDAENRLDIAKRIARPRTLEDMSDRENLCRLQSRLFAGNFIRSRRLRASATVNNYVVVVIAALNRAAK